jgi:hypothetical protein
VDGCGTYSWIAFAVKNMKEKPEEFNILLDVILGEVEGK